MVCTQGNVIINLMINKKSINARDILSLKSKESTNIGNACLPYQETQEQISMRYQTSSPDRPEKDRDFLSKIRVIRTNQRYRKQNHNDKGIYESGDKDRDQKGYTGNRSISFDTRTQTLDNYGISGHSLNQQIKIRRLDNFSPFDNEQLKERFVISGHICSTINNKISSDEIAKKLLRFKQLKQRNNYSLSSRKADKQTRQCAKLTQFNTEFSKTRLFDSNSHSSSVKLLFNNQNKRRSPYQLSQQRKNANLIKMRLNGLGSQADNQELSQHEQFAKIVKQNQINRVTQMRVKNQLAYFRHHGKTNTIDSDRRINKISNEKSQQPNIKVKSISLNINSTQAHLDNKSSHQEFDLASRTIEISRSRHKKKKQKGGVASGPLGTFFFL